MQLNNYYKDWCSGERLTDRQKVIHAERPRGTKELKTFLFQALLHRTFSIAIKSFGIKFYSWLFQLQLNFFNHIIMRKNLFSKRNIKPTINLGDLKGHGGMVRRMHSIFKQTQALISEKTKMTFWNYSNNWVQKSKIIILQLALENMHIEN